MFTDKLGFSLDGDRSSLQDQTLTLSGMTETPLIIEEDFYQAL